MALSLPFLDPSQLRAALLSFPRAKEKIVDTARIVAAYYLGFPLFVFKKEKSRLPSLFLWTQYIQEGMPEDVETLSREEMALILPIEYSPRFPIILLSYCNLELEAILYSDHFNDRRTALLLRLYIDNQYGLSLTNSHIADFCCITLPKYVNASLLDLNSLQTSLEGFVDSLLELDIILAKNYIPLLENFLIERVEHLFLELPIQSKSTEHIPRVPVYYTPESSQNIESEEDRMFLEIHVLIQIILYTLHKSNRLTLELSKAVMILSESRETRSSVREPFSIVVRILLVIMSIIFRDSYSLAVVEQWEDLPAITLKYKSLVGDISEKNRVPFSKWYSLATNQDVEHLNLFFEWARGNYQQESILPPFTVFTRDVWLKSLLDRPNRNQDEKSQTDWISGLLIHTNKIDSAVYNQMLFISSKWKCFTFYDPSLISIRLALAPSDVCSSKLNSSSHLSSRRVASARENFNDEFDGEVGKDDERIFTSRDDLAASFAKHGSYLLNRKLKEHRQRENKEAKYLKNLHRHNILEMMNNQMNLVSEIENEKHFLSSIDFNSASSPSTYSRSTSSETKLIDKDDDLWSCRLVRIPDSTSLCSARFSHSPTRFIEKKVPNGDCEVEELDTPLFDYEEVRAVVKDLPEIEKLDFSLLSPMQASKKSSTSSSSPSELEITKAKRKTTLSNEKNYPEWMKLLPLESRNTDRPQLFKLKNMNDVMKKRNLSDRTQDSSKINASNSSIEGFITTEALYCQQCTSVQSCLSAPTKVECPKSINCYSVSLEGEVFHKGCVEKCTDLSFGTGTSVVCATCSHDYCNGKGSILEDDDSTTVEHSDRVKYDIENLQDSDDLNQIESNDIYTAVSRSSRTKSCSKILNLFVIVLLIILYVS